MRKCSRLPWLIAQLAFGDRDTALLGVGSPEIIELIDLCLAFEPARRPSASALAKSFEVSAKRAVAAP
jgi:hypothetical protein